MENGNSICSDVDPGWKAYTREWAILQIKCCRVSFTKSISEMYQYDKFHQQFFPPMARGDGTGRVRNLRKSSVHSTAHALSCPCTPICCTCIAIPQSLPHFSHQGYIALSRVSWKRGISVTRRFKRKRPCLHASNMQTTNV